MTIEGSWWARLIGRAVSDDFGKVDLPVGTPFRAQTSFEGALTGNTASENRAKCGADFIGNGNAGTGTGESADTPW